jgi:16S rRNA (guanine527-N7)-methyltransferase
VGVNRWLNLTRIANGREWLSRHVLDSLTARLLPWWSGLSASDRCADLGSGGGYPGLPLALSGHCRWTLIDSRERKVRFLDAAGTIIDARRVEARAVRGSEAPHHARDLVGSFQVVTTRATAGPDEILPEAAPLLAPGGRLVVWQGPSHDAAAQLRAEAVARRLGFRCDAPVELRVDEALGVRLLIVLRKDG